jgi:DNA-directed RNA polymerase specialized sigma24 family protein
MTTKKLTDLQLMTQLALGDTSAIDELYSRHNKRVALTVRADFELSELDAADVVQETFKRVQLKAVQYRPTGKVISWILRIAKNIVIDGARAHLRRRRRETDYALVHPPEGGVAEAPEAPRYGYGDAPKAIFAAAAEGARLGPFPVWRGNGSGAGRRMRLWMNGAGEDSVRGMFGSLGLVAPKEGK